jgi:hypothetical protein
VPGGGPVEKVKKVLYLEEGQALPVTFNYKQNRFIFVVHRDLTITLNGTK